MSGKAFGYPRGHVAPVLHSLPNEQLKQHSTVWLLHHMYTKLRLSSMCNNLPAQCVVSGTGWQTCKSPFCPVSSVTSLLGRICLALVMCLHHNLHW